MKTAAAALFDHFWCAFAIRFGCFGLAVPAAGSFLARHMEILRRFDRLLDDIGDVVGEKV